MSEMNPRFQQFLNANTDHKVLWLRRDPIGSSHPAENGI